MMFGVDFGKVKNPCGDCWDGHCTMNCSNREIIPVPTSSDLRRLIIEWIKEHDIAEYWLLDLYRHLTAQGSTGEDALAAMSLFVDQAIARKTRLKMV